MVSSTRVLVAANRENIITIHGACGKRENDDENHLGVESSLILEEKFD